MSRLIEAEDDGLALPEAGEWAERKYRLIATYADIFATSMRGKWETRVYVDLFAAAGRARLQGSRRVIATSASLALGVRHPFDRYLLCESDPALAAALETRVGRDFPDANATVLRGDCNAQVEAILAAIPERRSLTFCLADPWSLGGLHFATVERLSARSVDFLVLIASYMDAHRNREVYLAPANRRVEDFLGQPDWRSAWEESQGEARPPEFGAFVVDRFGQSMRSLGYLFDGLGDTVAVAGERGTLYHLAFFSRNEMAREKFWREAKRYSTDQLDLFPRR